jgi:anti-sigma regulatory factor (Ser/Thr protein kinase)
MEIASTLVTIQEQTDVAEARRRGSERAARLGFDSVTIGRVAIAVTEAATNLLKHAGGGDILIGPAAGRDDHTGLQLIVLDRGSGIPNVAASLRDGFSTSGTPGTGLGAISRSSSTFDLYTQSGRGTVIAVTIYPEGGQSLGIGGLSVPMPGETECGDGWAVWSAGELTSILMVDGLGHGAQAAAAAEIALVTFRKHAERSAGDVMTWVHQALRSTRGAAVAVAELDHRQNSLRFCGIGNIAATVIASTGETQHLVSLSGIAGHVMRRVQPFSYTWGRGSLLVMHSDGVGSHWSVSSLNGLASRRPDVIAGVLFRDHRRGHDDASVVVARNGDPA